MRIYTLAFLILLLNLTALGQTQEIPKPVPLLTIEVENGRSLKLSAADLSKLPRKEVKGKDHDGKESTYSGVELREVLALAGATLGKELRGKSLAAYVLVEAADEYKGIFGIAELDNGFTDRVVILADLKETKPLSDTEGPWQIIVPDDKRHGRWVRQVTAVRLRFVR